jgi:hypothetical protein
MDVYDAILWGIGNLIAIAIAYMIAYHFKYKVKTQQEITWEKNRESVIWYSLSTIDNETIFMGLAFSYLTQKGIDFNEEEIYFKPDKTNLINHKSIQGQIDRLPGFSNALGFMTHEQYTAITDYLGYSFAFMKSLKKGFYQKLLLRLRSEKARQILDLFPGEEERHEGLLAWQECFQEDSKTS